MIARADFYSLPGSLSGGEYPLLPSNGEPPTSALRASYQVKCTASMQQKIIVPYFDECDQVNMCRLNGLWYWISSFSQPTIDSGTVSMVLDLAAPTSFLREGQSITANWHKAPVNICPHLHQVISNAEMRESRVLPMSYIPDVDATGAIFTSVFWVQLTGYDSSNVFHRFGFFVGYQLYLGLYHNRSVNLIDAEDNVVGKFPSLYYFLKNLSNFTGLLAENVKDLSIAPRCPYYYDVSMTPGAQGLRVGGAVEATYNDYTVYDLTPVVDGGTNSNATVKEYEYSEMITEMERTLGSLVIMDNSGATLATLPMSEVTNDGWISYSMLTDPALEGLYTYIKCGSLMFSRPEGKLPYLSDTWETYKAYQMEGDRDQMQNSIQYARYQQETDNNVGVMNASIDAIFTSAIGASQVGITNMGIGAGLTAALGVAQGAAETALSFYESQRNADLKVLQAQSDYALSQKRAVLQPQTAFNAGYGTTFATASDLNPLRICLLMPSNVDEDYYTSWMAQNGYAAEGVHTLNVTAGFYQGKLLDNASMGLYGQYYDELNMDMNRGFRFVEV